MSRYDLALGRKPVRKVQGQGGPAHKFAYHVGIDIGYRKDSCVAVVHYNGEMFYVDHMEKTDDVFYSVHHLRRRFNIVAGVIDAPSMGGMHIAERLGKEFKSVPPRASLRQWRAKSATKQEGLWVNHLLDRYGARFNLEGLDSDERDAVVLALDDLCVALLIRGWRGGK